MARRNRAGSAVNARKLQDLPGLRYSKTVMFLRNTFLVVLMAGVLSLSGCIFKKRKPPVPAQTQPPPITAPEPAPQEAQPATTEAQPPPPPVQEPSTEKAEAAAKTKPKRRTTAKKPAAKPPAATAQTPPPAQPQQQASLGGKIVIQEGGSPGQGQLSPTLTGEANNKRTTQQLLDATEANLKGIKRQLTPEEQAMVAQIKDYLEQSRKATVEADLVRARNLALKAHLLSDELVKR